MPLFAMLRSCNMLFDSSKHCNLMLFLLKSETVIICNLAMSFEHVLVISGDNSVFMFCYALPVHHDHAFFSYWGALAYCFGACNMPSCCFGQIVAITCIECVC